MNYFERDWYSNGQLRKQVSFLRDGKLNGECKFWRENGQLWTHSFYRDGRLEGEHKSWYDDGRFMIGKFYRNGDLNGEHRIWKRDGSRESHMYYRHGDIVDRAFSAKKKCAILRVKNHLLSQRNVLTTNIYIISDLLKLFC